MRAVVTAVTQASVSIGDETVGSIGRGYLILLGVAKADTRSEADLLARKICGLRVFSDEAGKMNENLAQIGGEVLVVSQFTLFADVKKGNRPSFFRAAGPETAEPLYEYFMEQIRSRGFPVEHGEFGAHMQVESVNDGPVTILYDTDTL